MKQLARATAAATEPVDPAVDQVLIRQLRLTFEQGHEAGREVLSRAQRLVLGSAEGVDLALQDPAVSRFHCEIRVDAGRVWIRDLGSRNGTLVDGVRVVEAGLDPGARIGLGRTRLRFDLGPEHVRVALSERDRLGRMVGRSTAMRAVFAVLERAAPTDATILLEGETGTGKEAAAESIHGASARRDRPLVVIDCGAIPPNLLESELFGHERGAFTGAAAARSGAFEAAHGGTVLLDEIGELAPELQPKILRALERREVKRIGANQYVPADVRVIAATNRDLRAEVNARRFRADLYYRLAVVQVRLPPLRERRDDLPLLVASLTAQLPAPVRAELGAPGFIDELARHSWPGNVRELRNFLERCAALGPGLSPAAGARCEEPSTVDATRPLRDARDDWTRRCEREYLGDLLRRHGDNLAGAARAAAIDRAYLYRLLWKHGLR
ncbi:MAG TPA: sigma 54-interacting transcriptional regulator [Kofleriaceae bacterium]|nr:sigma 54-interacting transcriptional regulator [Kofleriaceae bacterium]